ncbi:MAG: ribosomal protein S18-alanine N-acetyltransferase [Geopsychrobacter sp.]|nr:ribosomal protein S18-alanine N-acetyltransferase [Geopsychrobacter sp.]
MATDLVQVLKIEELAYPRPWTQKQFLQELQSTYSRLDLLFADGQLSGYLCYWIVAGEMHIVNIATQPAFRRRGVAHRLLDHALCLAKQNNVESACLEVRTGNLGAIALYRSFGFVDDCVRPKFYSDGEAALLMSYPLDSPSSEA